MAVTAYEIVASAEKLLGVKYRHWYEGDSIPMWEDDGYTEYVPDRSYFDRKGVECSDLINYALWDNGLDGITGTLNAWRYLEDQQPFNYYTPGQQGYVAYRPMTDMNQGHIALYWDDRYLIQALVSYGVTYDFTDQATYDLGVDTEFTIYAKLPGVEYPS
jgi:hypothetical protein